MKTTANNIIRSAARALFTAIAAVMAASFTSCSGSDSEPASAASAAEQVTAAHVTFTYTVPEELLKYAEITVCYNNNAGTDAKWQPMLDPKFTVTYDLAKFPVTAPVVMVYEPTNRPGRGVSVNWDLKMDVEVTMTVGGRTEVKTHSETYTISGDLAAGLDRLIDNVLDRTYAVKIAKAGSVQFVK